MEIYCKKCTSEIPFDDINIKEGIYSCAYCSGIFKIVEHNQNHYKNIQIEKPKNTKIKLIKLNDGIEITTPIQGVSHFGNVFVLLFSILVSYIAIFKILPNDENPLHLKLVFLGAGLLLFFIFLFISFRSNKIIINTTHIIKKFKILQIPISFRKVNLTNFEYIAEELLYKNHEHPAKGIVISFKNTRKMKFGIDLSTNERNWLVNLISNEIEWLKKTTLNNKANNKSPISR
jgi:hypothetical protein